MSQPHFPAFPIDPKCLVRFRQRLMENAKVFIINWEWMTQYSNSNISFLQGYREKPLWKSRSSPESILAARISWDMWQKRTYSLSCCAWKEQSLAESLSQGEDTPLDCLAHSSFSLSITSSSDFLLKVSVEEQQNTNQLWSFAMESPNIPHIHIAPFPTAWQQGKDKDNAVTGLSGPWQAEKHWLQAKKPRWNLEGR